MSATLKKFRELMTAMNIGVYVIPRTDEHQVNMKTNLE